MLGDELQKKALPTPGLYHDQFMHTRGNQKIFEYPRTVHKV